MPSNPEDPSSTYVRALLRRRGGFVQGSLGFVQRSLGSAQRRLGSLPGLLAVASVCAGLVLPAVVVASIPSGGGSAFSSRDLPPDPAWRATEGARAATAGELTAGFGNPAAASLLPGPRIAFSRLAWADELARDWGAIGWTPGAQTVFVVDAGVLHAPALPGYDAEGRSTGQIEPAEWILGSVVARALGGGWHVGFGGRLFRLTDGETSAQGGGLSAGVLLEARGSRVALAVTDIGPRVNGDAGSWSLPTRWRAGWEHGSIEGRWTTALCVEDGPTVAPRARVGLVFRPMARVELLSGVSFASGATGGEEGPWSGGLRVEQGSVTFAYAYHPAGSLGLTHQFGAGLRFGGDDPREARAPRSAGESGGARAARAPEVFRSAAAPAPSPEARESWAVWGSICRDRAVADSEVALLKNAGCGGAKVVQRDDGAYRVLARVCATRDEAESLVARLRAQALVVTSAKEVAEAP